MIENEAVIAATLKNLDGKIRLLKADHNLPGFQFQKGLMSWDFYNQKSKQECEKIDEQTENKESYFTKYENFEDVTEPMWSHV